jgi:ABC-type lipoprotein release transport system permease subunit
MKSMNIQTSSKPKTSLLTALRVGWFLAWRDIKGANVYTTSLIIFVMTLTFLNLIVVSGILVGLIEGSSQANREHYTGEIIISPLPKKAYIPGSPELLQLVKGLPGFTAVSTRYVDSAKLESDYKDNVRSDEVRKSAGGLVAGIDPVAEAAVTGLDKLLIEGDYLAPGDTDKILIGGDLLYKYSPIDTPSLQTLKNVEAGSKVKMTINGNSREYTVKGVLKSKVGEIDQRIFMLDSELRKLINRTDYNVDEMAIRISPPSLISPATQVLLDNKVDTYARVQTAEDAEPKFLKDIKVAFALLGNIIGSIGLAVASITIFIVIFVNAITRRRYIGILKGIGISSTAIEVSYMVQSVFYGLAGTLLGTALTFLVLQPFIAAHPINFPFSDGILVATAGGTATRAAILLIATIIAGYIPSKIVIRQNTLDAILGR